MQYDILYLESVTPYYVIQRDVYNGWDEYAVHSRHEDRNTAQLVKEALEARAAKE